MASPQVVCWRRRPGRRDRLNGVNNRGRSGGLQCTRDWVLNSCVHGHRDLWPGHSRSASLTAGCAAAGSWTSSASHRHDEPGGTEVLRPRSNSGLWIQPRGSDSFRRAAELDPQSPMPYWGIALAHGYHLNMVHYHAGDPLDSHAIARVFAAAR
jgi:hypothetical protein